MFQPLPITLYLGENRSLSTFPEAFPASGIISIVVHCPKVRHESSENSDFDTQAWTYLSLKIGEFCKVRFIDLQLRHSKEICNSSDCDLMCLTGILTKQNSVKQIIDYGQLTYISFSVLITRQDNFKNMQISHCRDITNTIPFWSNHM